MLEPSVRRSMPVTLSTTVLCAVGFLIGWATQGSPFPLLAFRSVDPSLWGPVTYPFADPGAGHSFISLVFTLFWFYWIGGHLEGELSSRRFAAFLTFATVGEALVMLLASRLLGTSIVLFGPGLTVAAATVAWGARNSKAVVRIWGILPVSGLVIVLLTIGIVLFGYGTGNPALGLAAVAPLGIVFIWASDRISRLAYLPAVQRISKRQLEQERFYYDDVKRREQKRAEEERLRKLLGE